MTAMITLYHKTARYSSTQVSDYQTVVGMSDIRASGKTKGPLIFDDPDLTRFILPGQTSCERLSILMEAGAATRLYRLMEQRFITQRHPRRNRDLAAAVLGCEPDKLVGQRPIWPSQIAPGRAYALVNTVEHAIRYYAVGIAPDKILAYSPYFGIGLLQASRIVSLWGKGNHGIITVGCKA